MHALGNATTTSVIAAESLVRNGYADYVSMETKTIEVEESRGIRNGRGPSTGADANVRLVKRAKLIITLKRSKDFHANMKKFDEIKEQNEKYIEAERAQREADKAAKAETAK